MQDVMPFIGAGPQRLAMLPGAERRGHVRVYHLPIGGGAFLVDGRTARTRRLEVPMGGTVARRATAVVLTAMGIGCSPGRLAAAATTSTVASTTPTTTVAHLEATIVGRWRATQQASGAAGMNPTDSARLRLLADYFDNPELGFLLTQYSARARDGIKTVGTLDLGTPRVERMTANKAIVVSCETDALSMRFVASGLPLPGQAGEAIPTPVGVRATLILEPGGLWKVSDTNGKEGTCGGF